jgi:hypothetical protein
MCTCGGREAVGKRTFALMLDAVVMGNEESGPSSLPSASSSLVRSMTKCRQSLSMLDCLPRFFGSCVFGCRSATASVE